MSMDYMDWFNAGELSECCGASVYNPADDKMGICEQCKEWCSITTQEEE